VIFNSKGRADVEAGLFFTFFGGLTVVLSLQYRLGTIAMMGPGMFPLILGGFLTILGLVILASGFAGKGEEARPLPIRPIILVALSVVVFAVLLLTVGLLAAIPAQVVIALSASEHFTWKRAIILSATLLAFCWGVFVYFLGISVPLLAV
jgi:hypothetical protein